MYPLFFFSSFLLLFETTATRRRCRLGSVSVVRKFKGVLGMVPAVQRPLGQATSRVASRPSAGRSVVNIFKCSWFELGVSGSFLEIFRHQLDSLLSYVWFSSFAQMLRVYRTFHARSTESTGEYCAYQSTKVLAACVLGVVWGMGSTEAPNTRRCGPRNDPSMAVSALQNLRILPRVRAVSRST